MRAQKQIGFTRRGVEFFLGNLAVRFNVDVGNIPANSGCIAVYDDYFSICNKVVKDFFRLIFHVRFVQVSVDT